MKYIVEIQPGVWLAPWAGDPGRTLVKRMARRYPTLKGARCAAARAARLRPGLEPKIEEENP